MAWEGYYTLDGAEVINAARAQRYARDKPWFKDVFDTGVLAEALGEGYSEPIADLAPWWDTDDDASEKFLGVYPINIVGVEDSSRTSNTVESTEDGAVPGRVRHGSKSMVFNVLLLAEDAAGAEYGMRWLRRVLLGDVCSETLSTQQSLGATLGYLASRPVNNPNPAVSEAEALVGLRRYLRRVVVNSGPTLIGRWDDLTCGGSVWNVQFTAVAGIPFEFGEERPIFQGYMDPSVTDPWSPGVVAGSFDEVSSPYVEVACPDNLWDPIYDPLCSALIVPPGPPSVPLGCYTPPGTWDRRKITIPAANVPLWGEVVPIIQIATNVVSRNIRLRIYQDPDGTFDPGDSPCNYIGDVVVSFIPAGGTLTLDGTSEEVFVTTTSGQRRRADSLVFRTDGKPFDWPALTCGYGHILTIDVPSGTATLPVVDMSLVQKVI